MERKEGIAAARTFVDTRFPGCLAALLCGSVARGEATPSSDLDILIVASEDIEFTENPSVITGG
jgi:predicted nucleotidyltransferase